MCETSVKVIQLNEGQCRDAACEKQWKQEVPLANILAQSCVTPPCIFSGKGVTHDCASILDSIAKGTSCFHYFSRGASLVSAPDPFLSRVQKRGPFLCT